MANETETRKKHVKKQENEISKPLSPERMRAIEEAYERDMDKEEAILDVFEYLDLNADCPNAGTRARQTLMKRAIVLIKEMDKGTYLEWLYRLSLKLNLNPRNVRESYLSPLIAEGIIKEVNGQLSFVGIPKKSDQK